MAQDARIINEAEATHDWRLLANLAHVARRLATTKARRSIVSSLQPTNMHANTYITCAATARAALRRRRWQNFEAAKRQNLRHKHIHLLHTYIAAVFPTRMFALACLFGVAAAAAAPPHIVYLVIDDWRVAAAPLAPPSVHRPLPPSSPLFPLLPPSFFFPPGVGPILRRTGPAEGPATMSFSRRTSPLWRRRASCSTGSTATNFAGLLARQFRRGATRFMYQFLTVAWTCTTPMTALAVWAWAFRET
jgi:hypothetical protein